MHFVYILYEDLFEFFYAKGTTKLYSMLREKKKKQQGNIVSTSLRSNDNSFHEI